MIEVDRSSNVNRYSSQALSRLARARAFAATSIAGSKTMGLIVQGCRSRTNDVAGEGMIPTSSAMWSYDEQASWRPYVDGVLL